MHRMLSTIKKCVMLLLVLSLLTGCSGNGLGDLPNVSTESVLSGTGIPFVAVQSGDYETVCENDGYQLQCRQDIGAFRVVEKGTQAITWNSIVTQDLYNIDRSTKTWKNYMQSIVAITYVSNTDTRGNYLQAYSAAEENTVSVTRFEQGIKVSITFAEVLISLDVEIALTDNGVRVRIPADSIKEESTFYLLSVELLPFFGAAGAEEDGYIFMPDGTGTLMHFSETDNKHIFTDSVSLDVYGNIEQSALFDEQVPQVFFPVYGIKRGETALFANVIAGDAYTRITVNAAVAMAPVKLNRSSFNFIYRHQYRIYLSNIVSNGKDSATTLYGTKCEAECIRLDRVVDFSFLTGDQADYSGMANEYRAYLKDNDLLNTGRQEDTLPLALRFFMGDEKDLGAFRKMVATTTLNDVENMVSAYRQAGVFNLQVVLQGWCQDGYSTTPQVFRPAREVGGVSQLKQLNAFLKQDEQVQMYLELNVTDATSGVGGFSLGSDVIQTAGLEPVTNEQESAFLLSPITVARRMEKALKLTQKYSSFNVAVKAIGETLYQDLSQKRRIDRQQTQAQWVSLLQKANEQEIALTGCAVYSLAYADFLYDLPLSSSLHTLADEDIPWLSMVLYGSIPLSTTAGNLSSDITQMKLQWIENGSVPTYVLTQESPTSLQGTDYNELFTSRNDVWQERILATYDEMAQRLKPVRNTTVIRHERPADGVVLITYANGYCVGINYTQDTVLIGEHTIPATDYCVWQEVTA